MSNARKTAREIVIPWENFNINAWEGDMGLLARGDLIKRITATLQKVERDTWRIASKRAASCMAHYPDPTLGDPNGCLIGLSVEFLANARGDGPDVIKRKKATKPKIGSNGSKSD